MSSRPPRRRLLRIESLEDRATPAVWNNPWPDPERLTVSFAPDGTQMGADGSSLFARLGNLPEGVWQSEMLRAFQAWAGVTNVSVSVVPDAGRPFGEAGPIQGSPHYGDIRIGAKPLTSAELAVATPFDLIGAGAGDIIVNSQVAFNQGGTGGAYDLYTVALQEAGHALGLGTSTDPQSVMFPNYQGPRTGLSAADVTAIRKLYGTRTPDHFESYDRDGNSFSDARSLRFVAAGANLGSDPTSGSTPYVVAADLTTGSDKDYYKVTNPSGSGGFFVELRTSGVSLLNARVSVYNKDRVLVKSAAAADPRTGDLSVYVANAQGNSTYYVKVEAAGSRFGVGKYRLAMGTDAYRAVFPPVATGLLNPDRHTNDTRSTADEMDYVSFDQLDSGGSGSGSDSGMMAPADARWDYLERASIEDATDKDWYKVNSGTTTGVLVAVVSATEAGKLDPLIRAYSSTGAPLPVDVLGNDASTYSIQVRGVTPNKTYYLEVLAAGTAAPANVGSYVLSADFRTKAIDFTTLAAGTLTDAAKQQGFRQTVTQARIYHLSLSAADVAADAAVRATIYDAANRVVASFVARDGQTVATDVLLGPGTYTIKLSAAGRNGQPLGALGYTLKGFIRNDPIGPAADDPTASGTSPSTTPPPFVSVSGAAWAYWIDDYSDPWIGL